MASLLDVGKNLFNTGKKATVNFLQQYPTPASYIQAKTNPVISPVPQTQQITPQDNRGIWATPFGRGMVQAQNNIQTAYNNPVVQQSIKNSVPWLNPLNPFRGFTEQLLPTAVQTGVNAGLEKITGNPMTFNMIPQSTLESYGSSGPLGKMQPVLTGGLQTLNAAMGALSGPAVATNPLNYAKTTALWNIALQGTGELAKGIREGKSIKETGKNVLKAAAGQGTTSGPLSGIFGESGLSQAADMALSIGLPLVIHGKTSELTNVPEEVQKQLRGARGRWVEGQKPIKPPKQTEAQWKFQQEFNKKYGRNPYEIVTNDNLRQALKIEADKRTGMTARPVGFDKISGEITPKPSTGGEIGSALDYVNSKVKTAIDNRYLHIKESPSTIELQVIQIKDKGKGLGTKTMDALKEYADKTGKEFKVTDVTNPKFFDKFNYLKSESAGKTWEGTNTPTSEKIYRYSPSTGGEIGGIKPKIKINEAQLQEDGWTELNNGNTRAALEDRFVDDITSEKYFDGEMPYTISTIESKVSKTGSATDMVKQIQNYAREQGKPIIITPDARPSRITETGTKTPLSQAQLESWYEKLGFKKITSGEEKGAMYWKPSSGGEIGGITASRTQSSKVPQAVKTKPSTKPIEQPISSKPLSSSALPKSIPLSSKSTSEQVAVSLPSRVDNFIQKTLGYSTQDPTGGTRKASLWTRTLRKGEEAFTSSVEKGLSSENTLVRNAASTLQNFFRGAGMSTERSQASMGLRGEMAVGTERAYNVMESLYKSLGNDKKSLERINAVLDPSIAKIKVNFNQLTPTEQQVYKIIREGLDIVHDTSYANGHITPEKYAANRGKYTPRMYEAMELPPEVNKFISQGKKIVNDLYKKRGEITDWKTENSLNDPVYALGKRLAQVETNNAVKKYVGYLASNPQFVSDVERAGFVKLSDSPAYGALKGKYVLNSAAEDLKGFFFANEGLDKLYDVFRIYDRLPIRQLQKKLLTVFNPTTNVGNIVSDQIFGFVSGVDPFTLNKNLLRLKNNPSEFKQLSDYLMKKGIVGTDITKTDFVNRMGQIDSLASGTKKGVFARISDKASSFYGGTDDAYKISALKSLLEKGFTIEEATRKVADGFQNYANVGKFYDVWSKTPVVGSAFIKFQGDLMRIIKNGAVNNPLGLITFLGTLAGVARLSSKLSGESDSDRVARENRFAAPMIPGLNIPLTWQTPMGEINIARYISPFYANNDVTNLSKMLPFVPNINPKKDVATNIALNANDPLTATAVQLAVNRDFRGKNIADPKENMYQPSSLTPQEKLKNQSIFARRGYTPPVVNSAIDVYSASQGKENMYGAKQSVPQALARMAGIKVQKYGPEEVAKAKETNDKYQESKNDALDRQINAVYKQQLKDEISPDQVKNRVNYLESQKVDSTGKSGTKEDIFRYLDAKGNMQSIDMNFQPTPPEKTGLEELDKKALSKFNGEITSKANDIYDLYKASETGQIKPGQTGYTTQDDANEQLSKLEVLKAKYSKGKSAKKITIKKVRIPKLTIKTPKQVKVANFSIKSPSMPKAKKSKAFKIKKIKPIKLAKLTIKSKTV